MAPARGRMSGSRGHRREPPPAGPAWSQTPPPPPPCARCFVVCPSGAEAGASVKGRAPSLWGAVQASGGSRPRCSAPSGPVLSSPGPAMPPRPPLGTGPSLLGRVIVKPFPEEARSLSRGPCRAPALTSHSLYHRPSGLPPPAPALSSAKRTGKGGPRAPVPAVDDMDTCKHTCE